jgi:curli biogenesis system outer membrane secretion channel CsgG
MRRSTTAAMSRTAAIVAASLFASPAAQAQGSPKHSAGGMDPVTVQSAAPPPPTAYPGPKKRIAVTKFDAVGGFVAQVGGADIGGGLAAQLMTELTRTGRFIVLERADLPSILREQQLGITKVATAETAAAPGALVGAQLLIRGSVTEFEQSTKGKGGQVGLSIAGVALGLGRNSVTGHVAIDLRLIDATTGEVLDSRRAEAQVTQRSSTANLTVGATTFGNSAFEQTALGQASRQAIDQAVDYIVARMEAVPWSARVVEVADGHVYVNAGQDVNLARGQRLAISNVVKELTDPATGLKLGVVERWIGDAVVESVMEKYSVARLLTAMQLARGDLVRVATDTDPAGVAVVTGATPAERPSLDALRQMAHEFESGGAGSGQGALPIGQVSPGTVSTAPTQPTLK